MGNQLQRKGPTSLTAWFYSEADTWELPLSSGERSRIHDVCMQWDHPEACVRGSSHTLRVNGEVSAFYGFVYTSLRAGVNIWYHSVDGRDRLSDPVRFLRASKHLVDEWLQRTPLLFGELDNPSEDLLRWVRFLGGVTEPLPSGKTEFKIKSKCANQSRQPS